MALYRRAESPGSGGTHKRPVAVAIGGLDHRHVGATCPAEPGGDRGSQSRWVRRRPRMATGQLAGLHP